MRSVPTRDYVRMNIAKETIVNESTVLWIGQNAQCT